MLPPTRRQSPDLSVCQLPRSNRAEPSRGVPLIDPHNGRGMSIMSVASRSEMYDTWSRWLCQNYHLFQSVPITVHNLHVKGNFKGTTVQCWLLNYGLKPEVRGRVGPDPGRLSPKVTGTRSGSRKQPGLKHPSGLRPSGRVNTVLQTRVWSNLEPNRGLYSSKISRSVP